jgi:succinate dehydrogenase/fumarate reductase flavoprotein subunit
MNPLVAQQIKQIAKGIEDLRRELAEAREEIERLTRARDDLQRRSWAQARETALYKAQLEDLAELKRENKRLTDLCQDFQQRLHRILDYAEALTDHLQV